MTAAKHCLAGALLALAVPLLALAAPAPVTGVQAEIRGADVVVSWEAAGSDVVSYRVYWSGESILDNEGDYDDTEETDGPVTTLTLKGLADDAAFVAVIAVNNKGEESSAFTEEAEAVLAPDASPELEVTRVIATSANQVRLTFDHDVVLALGDPRRAVRVEDPDGKPVATVSLALDGNTVLVTTAEQRAGKYRLTLAQDAFLGLPTVQGGPLAVFTKDSTHPFTSLAAEAASSSSARSSAARSSSSMKATSSALASSSSVSSAAQASSSSSEMSSAMSSSTESVSSRPALPVSNSSSSVAGAAVSVRLKDLPRADGFHDVEIGWTILRGVEVAELSIAQSVDGGRTFGDWQPLPPGLGLVRVNRVPAGSFAVSLAAFAPDGSTYEPAIATLALGDRTAGGGTGTRPPVGSVTDDSPLTSSGPASAALAVTVIAGALAGAWRFRRVPTAS